MTDSIRKSKHGVIVMIKLTKLISSYAGCLLIAYLLSGCAVGEQVADSETYKNSLMDFSSIRSVAVLPFHNLASDDDAAERARDTFMGMLLATEAIYVLPPGEVERGIERTALREPSSPSSEKVKALGNILKVDAVITGVLREYGSVRSGQTEANMISLSVQMLEVETGSIVWSAASTKGGIGLSERLFGGGGDPMDSVTREAIDDLLDQLFE